VDRAAGKEAAAAATSAAPKDAPAAVGDNKKAAADAAEPETISSDSLCGRRTSPLRNNLRLFASFSFFRPRVSHEKCLDFVAS
jgi:hypothetical protein